MKDRRSRKELVVVVITWSKFFWFSLLIITSFVLLSSSLFNLLPLAGRRMHHHQPQPELVSTWRNPVLEAVSTVTDESSHPISLSSLKTPPPPPTILQTVIFPDQISVFLNYSSPPSPIFNKYSLLCVYHRLSSSASQTANATLPPLYVEDSPEYQIVRCPLQPKGYSSTVGLTSGVGSGTGPTLFPSRPVVKYRWDSLAYEAVIDEYDNTTVVFVKGFNLRPDKLYDPTRFQCVYGWDFTNPKLVFRSKVLSIGEEIVRCRTPLGVLLSPTRRIGANGDTIKVSVRLNGKTTLPSVARPKFRPHFSPEYEDGTSIVVGHKKEHEMCVCTMLRNQAKFLKEWIIYHSVIGVQRWFIYDNNSDDDINQVIDLLNQANHNISRHIWPWIKSQEAGFAHCALRARGECQWVGFIDVDEFFHSPLHTSLHGVLQNRSITAPNVGEIRTFCYNFGPSGLKETPAKGVTVGYTCRVAAHERHKSIVRPEALSPTLMNVVHHFRLREGYESVTLDRPTLVINHYKYQVWEAFKEKFYRRVATYVSDWRDEENVGSKDRAPGLGTRAVEPPNWSARFCEVRDWELRNIVMEMFADRNTRTLPWEKR